MQNRSSIRPRQTEFYEVNAMTFNLTRRSFLGRAAAAGTAALLPSATAALAHSSAKKAAASGVAADTATQTLTNATVAKVEWKAKPFSMPEVRLLPSVWK